MTAIIVPAETSDQYHANPCCSSSKLKDFNERGPFYYRARYLERTIPPREPTDAMTLGIAFDVLMTEGADQFDARYVLKPPGMSFATKEGKEWRAAHVQGKTIIDHDRWQAFLAMQASIWEHPLFPVLLHKQIVSQMTVRMPESEYGIGLQCRPDWFSRLPCALSHGMPYSVNLKTTDSWADWYDESDPQGLRTGSPIYQHGYHRQAALDMAVMAKCPDIGPSEHFLFVVEKQQPYRCAVVQMTSEYLEAGWLETEADLRALSTCIMTDDWPRSPAGVVAIPPPGWLLARVSRKVAV